MMSRKVSRRPALRLLDHQGQAQTPSSSDIATSNQFVCEPWSRTAWITQLMVRLPATLP